MDKFLASTIFRPNAKNNIHFMLQQDILDSYSGNRGQRGILSGQYIK